MILDCGATFHVSKLMHKLLEFIFTETIVHRETELSPTK